MSLIKACFERIDEAKRQEEGENIINIMKLLKI